MNLLVGIWVVYLFVNLGTYGLVPGELIDSWGFVVDAGVNCFFIALSLLLWCLSGCLNLALIDSLLGLVVEAFICFTPTNDGVSLIGSNAGFSGTNNGFNWRE